MSWIGIILAVILGVVVIVIAVNLLGWLWGIISSILTSTVFWAVAGIATVVIVVHVIRRDDDADYGYSNDNEDPPYGQDQTYIPPEDANWQEEKPSSRSGYNTPESFDGKKPNSKSLYDTRSDILPPDSWDVLDGPSLTDLVDDDRKDNEN